MIGWIIFFVIVLTLVVAYLVVRVVAIWSEIVQLRKFVAEAVIKSDLVTFLSSQNK